ncbi:MAG: permease prefix domain 1-containing protein [Fusobacteriaceae bacterium]
MINKKNKNLDEKINYYLEELFCKHKKNQQLFELHEELDSNLREKISDLMKTGLSEEKSFAEAIFSMGDLKKLINYTSEISEHESQKNSYKKNNFNFTLLITITGIFICLFGTFLMLVTYMMGLPNFVVSGTSVFIVAGIPLILYPHLIKESEKKFAMKKLRALFYCLSLLYFLFAIFSSVTTFFVTDSTFVSSFPLMIFFLVSFSIFLFLRLTEKNRKKLINLKNFKEVYL